MMLPMRNLKMVLLRMLALFAHEPKIKKTI
jgi:hypothetical protein